MHDLPSFSDGSMVEPIPLCEENDEAVSMNALGPALPLILSAFGGHQERETSDSNPNITPSMVHSVSFPQNDGTRHFPCHYQAQQYYKQLEAKRARVDSYLSVDTQPMDEACRVHRFRPFQAERWDIKFQELLEFKKVKGHCCVPHKHEENMGLARWVKRQRHQYKLRCDGKATTITDRRVQALEEVGFVWDAHSAAWEERMADLKLYLAENGHCCVPTPYPKNPQLATWVKCQRRQYKLFKANEPSTITRGRYLSLNAIGFVWEVRGRRR